jgi:hypothetical protein
VQWCPYVAEQWYGLQDDLNSKEKDLHNCGTKAPDEVRVSPYPILSHSIKGGCFSYKQVIYFILLSQEIIITRVKRMILSKAVSL